MLYWEGMKGHVRKFVVECNICQRSKHDALSSIDLLQLLTTLSQIWEDISMNLVTELPKSH